MSLRGAFGQRSLRWSALGLAVLVAAMSIAGDADARTRRKVRHRASTAAAQRYQPPVASIVVDANSGAVMQATNADSPRHPASLTKIMTLYLLFERLEAGKLKMSSELPVSAHAAAQAPSKLGLKPGETIRAETAIRAIVTKSANDVAAIVAEAVGGDEEAFGRMMTAKARALGMTHTTYHNASGLPDDRQITTARDQSILARAMHDRFPQYYHYFSTRTFEFRGKSMRNHNHLLGRIAGVDGMKTGYINASGFNIVTSVHRGDRRIITVYFGGRTAGARDARVADLIDSYVGKASAKRTVPPIKEGVAIAQTQTKPKESHEHAAPAGDPAPGSTEAIKPTTVRTIAVRPGAMQVAAAPTVAESRTLAPPLTAAAPANVTNVATVKGEALPPPPGAGPGVLGVLPAETTKVASASEKVPVPVPARPRPEPAANPAAKPAAKPQGGWMIQVGAFDDEKEAKNRLSASKSKAKDQLAKASSFTERTSKGKKRLYRARFAGLDKGQAEAACKHLKRADIPCMVLRN